MSASSLHDVLLRPVISEKSTLESERNNYTFAVAKTANKFQIKDAVEELFKVRVTDVNVLTTKSKEKARSMGGRRTKGYTSPWRKAVVTLVAGDKIEFFEGV